MRQPRINLQLLNEDEQIVLYKLRSKGQIVGRYDSIVEIVRKEKEFNPRFTGSGVYACLVGEQNCFSSFFHRCRVVPKIIKKIV